MTILVDQPRRYPRLMFKGRARYHADKEWCHLASDTSEEELHRFADKLGLKREWFQGDHYDITASKRDKAVEYGAEEVTCSELVKRRYSRRDKKELKR